MPEAVVSLDFCENNPLIPYLAENDHPGAASLKITSNQGELLKIKVST
jgi:hypothetical protein